MTFPLKSAALAIGLALVAGPALACSADCCAKDKDGKMSCCDQMKDKAKPDGSKGEKPDAKKPGAPDPHAEHQH